MANPTNQTNQGNSVTGAVGRLKVGDQIIGKVRSVRANENYRLGNVRGIGNPTPQEKPFLEFDGTVNVSQYFVDFRKAMLPGSINRELSTTQQWVDWMLLNTEGIQLDVLKKVKDTVNENGIVVPKFKTIAVIKGVYIDSSSFDMNEGQISGKDASFQFTEPIIFASQETPE